MITHYWIEKGISALLIVIFTILGAISFGYPLYFDRLFIVVLFALIASYKINRDLFFVGLILLIDRLIEEGIFQLSLFDVTKPVIYAICLYAIYKFRLVDKYVSHLFAPLIVVSIVAETYWFVIGYDSPSIHYYAALFCLNSFVRHFLVFRVHILNRFSSVKLESNPLDFSLYRVFGVTNIVFTCMLLEYLIRHVTHYEPLIIYNAYSLLNQTISVITLFLITSYITKSKFKLLA